MTAEAMYMRSCGGGSDPSPLSSSYRSKETLGLCFSIYHIVARRAFNSKTMPKEYVRLHQHEAGGWPYSSQIPEVRAMGHGPWSSDLPHTLSSWRF